MTLPTRRGGIDYPDFGVATLPHQMDLVISLSEEAVRLGSSHLFERTGNVLFIEKFNNGLTTWLPIDDEYGSYVVLMAEPVCFGYYSVKLHVAQHSSAKAGIKRTFPYPNIAPFGCEFWFKFISDTDDLRLKLTYTDSTTIHSAEIKIKPVPGEVYYLDADNEWIQFGSPDVDTSGYYGWHVAKLVADFINGYYDRFVMDDINYNLNDIKLNEVIGTYYPMVSVEIANHYSAAIANDIYIDNIIVTINEPT